MINLCYIWLIPQAIKQVYMYFAQTWMTVVGRWSVLAPAANCPSAHRQCELVCYSLLPRGFAVALLSQPEISKWFPSAAPRPLESCDATLTWLALHFNAEEKQWRNRRAFPLPQNNRLPFTLGCTVTHMRDGHAATCGQWEPIFWLGVFQWDEMEHSSWRQPDGWVKLMSHLQFPCLVLAELWWCWRKPFDSWTNMFRIRAEGWSVLVLK